MKTFITIWIGQFMSRIGKELIRFALLIWAYNQTEDATSVALLGFFSILPMVVVSPFAGVLVDRYDRRKIMLITESGTGVMTLGVLLLHATGNLFIWHLYLAEVLAGIFLAFQGPTYTAITSQLLPKEQYARASGLRSITDSASFVIGPVLAGLLLGLGLGRLARDACDQFRAGG